MRVGLNLLHAHRGIGGAYYYIARIIEMLAASPGGNEYVAYVTADSVALVPACEHIRTQLVNVDGTNRLARIVFENTSLSKLAREDRVDVMHWFANTLGYGEVPGLVTIHDLLVFDDPAAYGRVQRAYVKPMIKRTVRKAGCLAPISVATKTAIESRFVPLTTPMIVVPAPIHGRFFQPSGPEGAELRERYKLPEHFWLYVSNFYPHKNHPMLLKAFAAYRNDGGKWPLFLRGDWRGQEGLIKHLLAELRIEDSVHFLPPLADEEMPFLYACASALVFPSTFEGAGMPVLEAMATGCPVLHSDIPTGREFAGSAARFFGTDDVATLTKLLATLESDGQLRQEMSAAGLERAEAYRTAKIAPVLHSGYLQAKGSNKP